MSMEFMTDIIEAALNKRVNVVNNVSMGPKKLFIHPLADVQTENIGENTRIWQFCVLLKGCKIGKDCNICAHVLMEGKVEIGDNVTIKPGVGLCDGVIVEDDVFIGAQVCFTNDVYPRSGQYLSSHAETRIKKGATVGTNSSVIAGCTIGEHAMLGAGSVLTRSMDPYTMWYGNPAKHRAYITKDKVVVGLDLLDKDGNEYELSENGEPVKKIKN